LNKVTEISHDELKELVRTLLIVMKNSIFYEIDHPLCKSSIRQFIDLLKKWFSSYSTLRLDISQYEFDINGNTYDQHQLHSKEIAQYLHNRGILSIIFYPNITLKELQEFFQITSYDVQTIKDKGGIIKCLPVDSSIKVKELDYSYFLLYSTEDLSLKEEEIWDALFQIANKKPHENLPESSLELILDFFKDAKKSARLLNKVYKNALNQLSGEKAIEDMRKAISQISQHLEQQTEDQKRDGQINIMNILFQLHIDLLSSLLKQSDSDNHISDLSKEIVKHFSDTDIADFISSLIVTEGSLNERLIRIFDKLVPDESKSNKVVPLVADQLFSQNIIHPFKIEPMQMSIKEIFKQNPKSHFLNQMYEITVDAVINKNIDALTYIAKLTPEISKFVKSMKGSQLIREKVLLILNLLHLENDSDDFKKLNNDILNLFPLLLQQRDIVTIRDIFDFYTQKVHPEQKNNIAMGDAINKTTQKITSKESIREIISYIPDSNHDLHHITYILENLKEQSVPLLISAYLKRPGSVDIVKFKKVFTVMKREIITEISKRLKSPNTYEIKVLFPLLKQYAPVKARKIARYMIDSSDKQILLPILDNYDPQSREEVNKIFNIYFKSSNNEIKSKAAVLLLKTRNREIIEILFRKSGNSFFKKSFTVDLVRLCGDIKVKESFPLIREIFIKRSIFSTRKKDKLRLTAAISLLKLQSADGYKLIKSQGKHGSRYFRNKCKKILSQYSKLREKNNASKE